MKQHRNKIKLVETLKSSTSLTTFPIIKLEYSDGVGWYNLATEAYVDSRIAPGGIASITGFVEGANPVLGVLTTTRGPTCLLTNIPAGGNVDMGGFSVKNMQAMPDDGLDAASASFIMKLLSDEVCVIWP